MEIKNLRNEIDNIDNELVELYKKRMEIVKQVGDLKKANAISINHSDRENEIVYRVTSEMDNEMQGYTKKLFETLFETSKSYQSKLTNITSPSLEKIKKCLAEGKKEFPLRATVACQGVLGSNSSIATRALFEIPKIMYFKSFDAVFNAVESGFSEYGILPIENSSVGSVNLVYDLMREHKFNIVRSIQIRITHNLLVNKGTKVNEIKEIVSHEQALNQCRKYIEKYYPNAKLTPATNTATAARYVKESGRKDIASISSYECKDVYGLDVLDKNIEDKDGNYTRFICISKNLDIFKGADKISFMANLPHKPGSLYKFLSKFATLGLNLTKMESRPLDGTNYKFMFYFDFEGDIESKQIQNLIAFSENESKFFELLGSYSEVRV